MKPEDDIHKMIKKIHLKASTELDKRVQDDISQALVKTENAELAHAKSNIRRSITKGVAVKFAIAAAILIAFGVGFSVGRWSQPPLPKQPSIVVAHAPAISIHSSASKPEDGFWKQKAIAAMQPKLYVQNQITKTNLIDAYKQYLKEKHYD